MVVVEADTGAFGVKNLTPKIGSLVEGLDIGKPLSQSVRDQLYQTLLERKVLFFRGQNLETEQYLDFSRQFGELEIHPFAPPKEGHKEILVVPHDKDNPGNQNAWHSDVTWRLEPSMGGVLWPTVLPSVGGDTLWADMEAAYDDLPDELKDRLDGMIAIHDFEYFRIGMKKAGVPQAKLDEFDKKYPLAEHPVVRTHPETGRKCIFVNIGFTRYIKDMEREESDALLRRLYMTASRPEYQVRFTWDLQSVAFFDNRCTQHYAVADYWPETRIVERSTIIGGRPR